MKFFYSINCQTWDADIIYVVNEGKIVASGTHKELLKHSTIYKNLYEMEDLDIS